MENKTNLIINYLPQMLSDTEFKNLFLGVGPVKAAKIVRHKNTGYSYGFGFVEFAREADAERAIETLNGFNLQNKKIKVAYSRPGGDNIKNANLYIKGVPKGMSEEHFESIMAEFGKIIQCRLLKDATGGRNKGVGFTLFDQKCEADEAIKKLNGQVLEGGTEPLSLKYAEDNAKKVRAPPVNAYPSPYAADPFMSSPMGGGRYGGGPLRQSIQGRFRYNPMGNSMGGMGNGMGGMGNGMGGMGNNMGGMGNGMGGMSNNMGGMGNNMGGMGYGYGSSAPSSGAEAGGHILFVYNIGPDTDEKTIWQLFGRYGTVTKVNVIREGGTGMGKGYGFVTMPSYDEACIAIESLNGMAFYGKQLQVSFKTSK